MNDHSNPNDEQNEGGAFPDELISAYLDGELSPAEKLRVEEQLMDSAEHRQLFEELKALRRGMHALPQRNLDANFAARVLERAEKELLTEDEPESAACAPAMKPIPHSNDVAHSDGGALSDGGAWRGLFWSVAAMAAAILLMVFSPWLMEQGQQHGERGVAVNQAENENKNVNEQLEKKQPRDGEMASNQFGQSAEDEARQLTQLINERRTGDGSEQGAKQQGAGQQGIELQAAAEKSTARSTLVFSNDAADKGYADRANREIQNGRRAIAGGGVQTFAANGQSAARGRMNLTDGAQAGFGSAAGNQPAVDAVADNAFRGGALDKELQQAAQPMASNSVPSVARFQSLPANRNFQIDQQLQGAGSASDMMVVSVDVTPDALREHFLEGMLAKHNIQTPQAEKQLAALSQEKYQERELLKRKHDAQLQDSQARDDVTSAEADDAEVGRDLKSADQLRISDAPGIKAKLGKDGVRFQRQKQHAAGRGDVDVMMVVATPDQIDGLLADMRAQSQYVLAMAADQPAIENAKKNSERATEGVRHENNTAEFSVDNKLREESVEVEKDNAPESSDEQNRAEAETTSSDAAAKEEGEPDATTTRKDSETAPAARPQTNAPAATEPAAAKPLADELKNQTRSDGLVVDAENRYAAPEQPSVDDFRGIARRLHLPEDFQKNLASKIEHAGDGRHENLANPRAPPAALGASELPTNQDGQGQGQLAGQEGGQQGGEKSEVGNASPSATAIATSPKRSEATPAAKQQNLVRVLFVIRATGSGTAVPPAVTTSEDAVPPAGATPALRVPANVEAQEVPADVAPAPLPE